MNILNKISLKNLKLNKKRTIGTIIGIILSVALITAVAGMFESLHQTLIANTAEETGYYHYALERIDPATLNTVRSNRQVQNVMTSYELGVSTLQIAEHPNSFLYVHSTAYFDDLPYHLQSGRKPANASELAIPSSLAIAADLKVGDTLELNLGTRMTSDGYELNISNPYYEEDEYIANPTYKKYKIVGIYKGSALAYYGSGNNSTFYTGITTEETSDIIDAFVALKNPKERETFLKSLAATGKFGPTTEQKYSSIANSELLRWEVFAFSDTTIMMLYSVIGIIIGIIVVTSIFCIRNSFAISTTEKRKMLGMLASIGATKKQIKKSVLIEGFFLGLIGIPLGIVSGIFADLVLIKVVNLILKDFPFDYIEGFIFTVSWEAILVATILGIVTIYFSAIASAHSASKISPIENVRSSKDISLNAKNMKTPPIIGHLFKTGGILAYKNLRRSKKKYRTTVISLAVSVFIFIAMNSFLTETFKMTNVYYTNYDYNVILENIRDLTTDEVNGIRNLDNIDSIYIIYEAQSPQYSCIRISDLNKINILPNETLSCENYDPESDKCLGDSYINLQIFALDDATFRKYTKDLGLKYEKSKTKGILIDEISIIENGKTTYSRRYKYKKGEIIKGLFLKENFEIEIAEITDQKPYGLENYSCYGGYLIVDKEYFSSGTFIPYRISISSSDPDKLTEDLNKFKSNLSVYNIESEQKREKAMTLVISIFLYGFIAVITLIGITNIFNTITSNMELRQQDFAMLKSIGMTKKEFSRMINLETLFYSSKSLIYGITLGLIGAYALHRAFGIHMETEFNIPWLAILISIMFVFILVSIIMRFSISKIAKQNTIETIRKENI